MGYLSTRLLSVSPATLARVMLDIVLITSWAWLASDHLPHEVALVGVGLFAAVSGWFWCAYFFGLSSSFDKLTTEKPAAGKEAVAKRADPRHTASSDRLAAFTQKPQNGRRIDIMDARTGLHERWYLESRLEEESRRSLQRNLSLAVLVLRFESLQVSDWTSDAWREKSSDVALRWVQALGNCDLAASVGANEVAICLFETGRSEAEERLEAAAERLEERCEAGLVIFPDEHPDSTSLVQLAKLRAQPLDGHFAVAQ